MTAPPMDLGGRRILLTGAAADSDIGRSIAETLAGLGARLILTGRRADALDVTRTRLPDPTIHTVAPFDLTDLDAIPRWMKGIATEGGPLDGVVHSASVQGYTVLRTLGAADFDRYFRLNTGAAAMLARGFQQKGVHGAGGGALVFIGSVAGLSGQRGRSLYSASKAALTALAQSLALELADKRIRVNVVAPAVVLGRQAERQFAMLAADQRAALDAAHPLGYGTPADVAGAVAFLLADTGRWISGITLPVDGGFLAG